MFRAHNDPELVAQWIGPKYLENVECTFEARHGGTWTLVQRDPDGNEHGFRGVVHGDPTPELSQRTFEWLGMPGHVSFETMRMEDLGDGRTRVHASSVFMSVADRDGMAESGMGVGRQRGLRAPRRSARHALTTDRTGGIAMSTVLTHMTMSLDGFIADPHGRHRRAVRLVRRGGGHRPDEGRAVLVQRRRGVGRAAAGRTSTARGALVCGRRLFDITNGWDDQHPMGAPVVVVTHHAPDDADQWPRTTFVDDVATGIERAKEIAGDKNVVIASANVAAQALDLGLVDEVHVSLVPVLMGEGIPYFANLGSAPHRFDDPVVIPGKRATHLQYTVRRD